ncbi:hypothetical protein [Sphingomonas sp.]|uniref:hypothetical protein n=1 Tax=Sphingomonas sp. TaxID=28214 RepID=UPI0031DB9F22
MPDVQDTVTTASTAQPVSFQPQRIVAADLDDGKAMRRGRIGSSRTISPAKLAALVGLGVLCWVPVAAILVALLD